MASPASASWSRNCRCIWPGAGLLDSVSIRRFPITLRFPRTVMDAFRSRTSFSSCLSRSWTVAWKPDSLRSSTCPWTAASFQPNASRLSRVPREHLLRASRRPMPGQPHQWRQGAGPRHSACGQSRGHSVANGGPHLDPQPYLRRSTIPPVAHQARCPESHYGDGPPARPIDLSNVEVRSARYLDKVLNTTSTDTADDRSTSSERKQPNWASRSRWENLKGVPGEGMSSKKLLLRPVAEKFLSRYLAHCLQMALERSRGSA